jgi:protein-S-isoprenylcysteine O-methyltransferase Ste14
MDAKRTSPETNKLLRKAVGGFLVYALVTPALLFLAAGTLNWPMAWLYVLATLTLVIGSRIIIIRKHPDLVLERGGAHSEEGVQEWDKKIVPIVGMLGPMVLLIVCGLDKRWSWSPEIGPVIEVGALVAVLLCALFSTWAMLANKFFSATVRIQKDRGHSVVSSGPYRFVRHPSYLGGILADFAGPLALGSLWALVPGVLLAALTVYRTMREDKVLQEQLDGYAAYAKQVRYRLLPGVW